jgi:hypothetical protein
MRILIKFASRSRREKFFACLDNIRDTIGVEDYTIFCSLDVDDSVMNTHEVCKRIDATKNVMYHYWFSESKVDAINRDMDYTGHWDILLNHSDDFWFIKQGWGKDILEAFEGYSGLVHFPDQYAGKRLCTYSMMSRDYYLSQGFIYYPGYKNVYCDLDQQDVAKILGKYKFVDKNIFEHRHHYAGFGPKDELFIKTEDPVNYAKDRETYFNRIKNDFGLQISDEWKEKEWNRVLGYDYLK